MTAWHSQRLGEHHQIDGFSCGEEVLNRWLSDHARRAQAAGTAATFVWTLPGDAAVVSYYAVAPTLMRRDDLPSRRMAAGYSDVPGYLLGRLALDASLHGQGLGSELLINALERIVTAAEHAAGRVVVVDAIDDTAASFYEHHDFRRVGNTSRLVMTVATARDALDQR